MPNRNRLITFIPLLILLGIFIFLNGDRWIRVHVGKGDWVTAEYGVPFTYLEDWKIYHDGDETSDIGVGRVSWASDFVRYSTRINEVAFYVDIAIASSMALWWVLYAEISLKRRKQWRRLICVAGIVPVWSVVLSLVLLMLMYPSGYIVLHDKPLGLFAVPLLVIGFIKAG